MDALFAAGLKKCIVVVKMAVMETVNIPALIRGPSHEILDVLAINLPKYSVLK